MPTVKTPVIEYLRNSFFTRQLQDGIVYQDNIVDAINSVKNIRRQQINAGVPNIIELKLSTTNPANFLKDIIRNDSASADWPEVLTNLRITARQRYGEKRVFQFVRFLQGQVEPFPDNYLPNRQTHIYSVQSATIPFAARQLGRGDESWLMQVVVALRIIETHLAMFSPQRATLRDLTHLQMSMKTRPEIDAVFLASYGNVEELGPRVDQFTLVTCEAKQLGQRILEDQIREQVGQAFKRAMNIAQPVIQTVKPLAIQVKKMQVGNNTEEKIGIFVVEFQHIQQIDFIENYKPTENDPERLYSMPLIAESTAFYQLSPPILGINA